MWNVLNVGLSSCLNFQRVATITFYINRNKKNIERQTDISCCIKTNKTPTHMIRYVGLLGEKNIKNAWESIKVKWARASGAYTCSPHGKYSCHKVPSKNLINDFQACSLMSSTSLRNDWWLLDLHYLSL